MSLLGLPACFFSGFLEANPRKTAASLTSLNISPDIIGQEGFSCSRCRGSKMKKDQVVGSLKRQVLVLCACQFA